MISANVIGRLTRDVEVKSLDNGADILRFAVASNHYRKGSDQVTFLECHSWHARVIEFGGNHLKKGSLVNLSGTLYEDSYEVNGEKRKRLSLEVDRVNFLPQTKKKETAPTNTEGESEPETESAPAQAVKKPMIPQGKPASNRKPTPKTNKPNPSAVAPVEDTEDVEIPF
jgi:single-strand DNA-binding protein